MNREVSDVPLTSQEMSRVIALSATIAGALLFLYFADLLAGSRIDFFSHWQRLMMEADVRFTPARKYTWLVIMGTWGVGWLIVGIDSIRSQGNRRLAVAAVAILVFGISLALMTNSMMRDFSMRGVGYSP